MLCFRLFVFVWAFGSAGSNFETGLSHSSSGEHPTAKSSCCISERSSKIVKYDD